LRSLNPGCCCGYDAPDSVDDTEIIRWIQSEEQNHNAKKPSNAGKIRDARDVLGSILERGFRNEDGKEGIDPSKESGLSVRKNYRATRAGKRLKLSFGLRSPQ